MSKKLATVMALFGVVALLCVAVNASPAGAKTANVNGFCGPAFANKAQMIAWYRKHPARRAKAEKYVRAHAGYYHIQADQSFISWLTNPHLIIKKAPAGYVLISNTYCDAAGNVHPYNGKLAVGGVPLLWWCSDTSGTGHNCTPVAKYYCRNWVRGHMAFPHHKPVEATIYLRKGCITAHQDKIDCPSNLFGFVFNGKHVFYAPPPSSDKMVVGRCRVGRMVSAEEVNIPEGWEIDPGTSAVQPAQKCVRGGILFTFKNMETSPPPPSNGPPTGHLDVPMHLIVNGIGKVSVDSISDPDDDPVTVSFMFKDVNGNTLDLSQGPVFSDGAGVISMMIKAPSTPMNVYVYATLSDGVNPPVTLPVGSFPVVADPGPSK